MRPHDKKARITGLMVFLLSLLIYGLWNENNHKESEAAGLKEYNVLPETRDEGDSPIPFSVNCSSASSVWTLVATSDTIRRSIHFLWPSDNADKICLVTSTATYNVVSGTSTALAWTSCADTTPGIELSSRTASYISYSKATWFCASWPNNSFTNTVKGTVNRDKRDYGWINSNALQ